ncbi:MAG: heme exporter protein CcmB [Thermoleophilia bacterium]
MGRQLRALLRKDLVSELRTKEMLVSMFLFAVLAMIVFHYAFTAHGSVDLTYFTGGMLWVVFIFSSLLGLNRSFVHEKDEGCLEGLLLCPVDRVTIFFAKMLGNLIFLLVVQALTVPVFTLFFVSKGYYADLGWFLAVLLFADIGICTLGTLLATISMNTRARDLLLPIVFLPLIVPLLVAATSATTAIFANTATAGSTGTRLLFMAGYDAVFLVAAWGTYDFAIGEA